MSRRYLTAADVRRNGAGELVVDADTVVTPQAVAVAQAIGVVIRTASGAYVEPEPDRGPDAERAMYVLPHMPEPTEALMGTGVIVTVVGCNRPGVLAEVTAAIADVGGNVNDVTQKMVDRYFHLVLIVELPDEAEFAVLKERLEQLSDGREYVVRVMHERVFRFMHRV